jgi:hypothetical protein
MKKSNFLKIEKSDFICWLFIVASAAFFAGRLVEALAVGNLKF